MQGNDMELITAKSAGFCFGVKKAVETVAPGRLYLGCRFCKGFPDAIRAAADGVEARAVGLCARCGVPVREPRLPAPR